MIPLTTVVLSRALWLYALLLFLVPVCKAQVIVSPCSSDSFSDSALVPPRNYSEFVNRKYLDNRIRLSIKKHRRIYILYSAYSYFLTDRHNTLQ